MGMLLYDKLSIYSRTVIEFLDTSIQNARHKEEVYDALASAYGAIRRYADIMDEPTYSYLRKTSPIDEYIIRRKNHVWFMMGCI